MILNSFSTFVTSQVGSKNLAPIKSRLAKMTAVEIADALKEVRPQDIPVVYRLLDKSVATEVFDMLDLAWQKDLIQALTGEEAAALFRAIEPEDRVHL